MVISGSLATDKCTTCSECKVSTSEISKNPQVRAIRKFQLVHRDLCGPFPESLHRNKYAVILLTIFQDMQQYILWPLKAIR